MDRKRFVDLCLDFAITGGHKTVCYSGAEYFAKAYSLDFSADGKPRHTAVIKDVNANCYLYVDLKEISEG